MSAGHQSMSNEAVRMDALEAASIFETVTVSQPTASTLPTQLETVPGYRPRGLAGTHIVSSRSRTALEALEESAPPTPYSPLLPILPTLSVRDAATAAFGTFAALEVVFGQDDRQKVADVEQAPWRSICALRIKTQDQQQFVGTGWFIGPRTVLTAGHCVYLHDHGGWASSIEVIPALDGINRPYRSAIGSRYRAVDGWTQKGDSAFDYAAIVLDEKDTLGDQTGWFAFASLDSAALIATDANICGYPADRDQATHQYYHARKITRTEPRQIFYDIDTFGGQSGSPIWLQVNGQRVAIGIHTTGSSTANAGTRIIKEVFDNMKLWKSGGGV